MLDEIKTEKIAGGTWVGWESHMRIVEELITAKAEIDRLRQLTERLKMYKDGLCMATGEITDEYIAKLKQSEAAREQLTEEVKRIEELSKMLWNTAMQQQERAEQAEAQCNQMEADYAELQAKLQRYEVALKQIAEDKHYPCGVSSYAYIAREALGEGEPG